MVKWYEGVTYRYKATDRKSKALKHFDIKIEDAFHIWEMYNSHPRRRDLEWKWWSTVQLKISLAEYFKFLRAEGYDDFIWPVEIQNGVGYNSDKARHTFVDECLGCTMFEFRNQKNAFLDVYVRLHEWIAYQESNWCEPTKPGVGKARRIPCTKCGAKSQKECKCKRRK